MIGTQLRLPSPGIASVIFAPAPANYTPSSVTTCGEPVGALQFEWPTDEEKECFWYALRTRRRDLAEVQRLFSALLGPSLETLVGTHAATSSASGVPARNYPFARHLDLLSLPVVEGMNFDVEAFSE